jgi:hypothetical protein
MNRIYLATLIMFLISTIGYSQNIYEQQTENTIKLKEKATSPNATIEEMAWYTGRWSGEGFGGWIEENVGPPVSGSMSGSFRMIQEDKPVFYEFILIKEVDNSLEYQVKHFNPDLSGWEEKNDYHSFKLVKIEKNKAHFEGMTLMRKGDKMHIYLVVSGDEGKKEEHLTLSLNP